MSQYFRKQLKYTLPQPLEEEIDSLEKMQMKPKGSDQQGG